MSEFYRHRRAGRGPEEYNGIRDEIVSLAGLGHTYDYIATVVGVSASKVGKILKEEFQKNFAGRQELIEKVAWQLGKISRTALLKYDESGGTDHKSAETALKAIDQTRRMFGLDEATKLRVEHAYDSMTTDELAVELAKYRISTTLSTPALPPAAAPDSVIDAEFALRESLPQPIEQVEAEPNGTE